MNISKNIISTTNKILNLTQHCIFSPTQRQLNFLKNIPQINLTYSQKFSFSQHKNTASNTKSQNKVDSFEQINAEIQKLSKQLIQNEQFKEMKKIIYPEALLHGQQNVSKLSKLYDKMIQQLERQNIEHQKRFYHKMDVRRLKALKPYLKAKHHIQTQNLHKKSQHKKIYTELCDKIDKLIKQDIEKGQYQKVQHYYNQGLKQQKSENQLQSLYYYHKGICISEYQNIPDKLLHFNLLAHYVFLSELMRPKCQFLSEAEQYNESIEKYDELKKLGQKWSKQDFSATKDLQKKQKFQQTRVWILSNKGNILFKAKKYQQAIKYYQQVVDHYKISKSIDERLKIIKVIQCLQKSYEKLGMEIKGIQFLQWAHDFIKDQISQSKILRSRYLKPIDEMLIELYKKGTQYKSQRVYNIQRELKQIVQ